MNKENADVFNKIYGQDDTLKICLRKLLGYELFEKECFLLQLLINYSMHS